MDRRATEGLGVIDLGGRAIEYRFARRRRRTLGISIDGDGMRVALPLRAAWREVEEFLRAKEHWILEKLEEWSKVPRAPLIVGMSGEVVPVFGEPHVLEVHEGRRHVAREGGRLIVSAPRWRALETLVRWMKDQALAALAPRAAHYAARLGRAAPRILVSNARTQWGVCSADGSIRLSWRLAQIEPPLADYVVAHEVAHLVELNHSRRFWNLVASLYPDWRAARESLELAGAALPVMKGKR